MKRSLSVRFCSVCPLMRWMIRRTMRGTQPDSPDNRTRLGALEGWVSTGLSILLCTVKMIFGLLSGSIALLADATNNLTDVGSSLVIALGFHWSRKPRDMEHPFGHGRIEYVSALILAMAFLLVGIEVSRSGVARLIDPQPVEASAVVLAVVAVTVLIKLWLALFARGLAELTASPVLAADAWNHIFDVLSTVLVLLALIGSRWGWAAVDGWAAVGVGLFIIYLGIKYARESIDSILGAAPDADEVRRIHAVINGVEGVFSVHDVIVHQYGDIKLVSFHIEVCGAQSAYAVHDLAEQAEAAVEQMGCRAIAHVDPVDRSHPRYTEVEQRLLELVRQEPDLTGFHDLRLMDADEGLNLSLDLVSRIEIGRAARRALLEKLSGRVFDALPKVQQLELGIETELASRPTERRLYFRPIRG
jgi:cation diffusion facilitator family transporter